MGARIAVITIQSSQPRCAQTSGTCVTESAGVIVVTWMVVVVVDTPPRNVRVADFISAWVAIITKDRVTHTLTLCAMIVRTTLIAVGTLAC